MVNHLVKFGIAVVLLVSLGGGFMLARGGRSTNPEPYVPPEVSLASNEENTPLTQEESYVAPNGKATLIIKDTKVAEGVSKVFSIVNEKRETYEIYSKTIPADTTISVPYNTFSPDNKYIFLKEENQWGYNFYFLSTAKDSAGQTGTVFTTQFKEKYPDVVIEDVTGWGGMTLIVINAQNEKSSGLSYWYDVASGRFTQLSNRFD